MNLKCSDCGNELNEFERLKVFRLEEYWGGRRKIEPRCAPCYHAYIEEKKTNASTVQRATEAGNQSRVAA